MIDHAAAAREVLRIIEASPTAGKPIFLVGTEVDRDNVLEILATTTGSTVRNLGIDLSQALIDRADLRIDAAAVISGIAPGDLPLLLGRIQILMLPQLRASAIDTLIRVARRRPVCASWPGRLEHGRLRYANQNHPECLDEDASRVLVFDLSTNQGTDH